MRELAEMYQSQITEEAEDATRNMRGKGMVEYKIKSDDEESARKETH